MSELTSQTYYDTACQLGNALEKMKRTLSTERDGHAAKMAELSAAHKTEITELKLAHAEQIQTLQNVHTEHVAKVRAEDREAICARSVKLAAMLNERKTKHAAAITELENSFAAELANLKETHRAQTNRSEDRIREGRDEIAKLRTELEECAARQDEVTSATVDLVCDGIDQDYVWRSIVEIFGALARQNGRQGEPVLRSFVLSRPEDTQTRAQAIHRILDIAGVPTWDTADHPLTGYLYQAAESIRAGADAPKKLPGVRPNGPVARMWAAVRAPERRKRQANGPPAGRGLVLKRRRSALSRPLRGPETRPF